MSPAGPTDDGPEAVADTENQLQPKKRKVQHRRRWRRQALRFVVACLAFALLAALWLVLTLPSAGPLAASHPESTAFMDSYRAQGHEPAYVPVPYERISPSLKRAVLVAEDIGFFSHNGFAGAEIRQAIRDTLEEGKPLRGASTISQQLAKNLWLSPSRNPMRKIKEVMLTRRLERRLHKHRILELYLNVVEFGPGVYGAEAAAQAYFNKPAAWLSEYEAASLAAALPHSKWSPESTSASYNTHRERILRRMEKAAWLEKVI